MNKSTINDEEKVLFYVTAPHDCGYLNNKQAVTTFLDPNIPINTDLYSLLIAHGFRRSGDHIYRPNCPDCHACIPVRIPVKSFKPKRTQKRIWKRNHDLVIMQKQPEYNDLHFKLYQNYISIKHPGGGMDDPDPNSYLDFLSCKGIDTRFTEFWLENHLVAVAVVDVLEDGLSALYTFYDPEYSKRSLGVFTILWQIEESRRLGFDYLYLGYWIAECTKMSYKNQYRPFETYLNDNWSLSPS